MKILLLLGIHLLAMAAGKAQQPQAEKPPEAPAPGTSATSLGQTPAPGPGNTAPPDQPRRAMEPVRQNDDAKACLPSTPELEAHIKARTEEAMREFYWKTFCMARNESFRRIVERRHQKFREKIRLSNYLAEGGKPELEPLRDGIPYFLLAISIKPAG